MTRQSDALALRIEQHVARTVQMLVLEIDRLLRDLTPVDTGHARANWVPSVGEPLLAVVVGDAAHVAGVARILAYSLRDGAAFITNNVPYIRRLNDGSSPQAPAGFIELAIAQALATVEARGDRGVRVGTIADLGGDIARNLAAAYNPLGGA